MTTITKLGIQGIRSFDHEHLEVLDFERPVTLIVGPNGSGKTTIIECLKMASSGVLPPNARNGHGFVHDPQLAHLPEVKAQIRMLFKTGTAVPKDREICAIRSFQLTNKRQAGRVKPVYKALDSVLRTQGDDGTRASLSHRCADMDLQVPELMGVSRSVLEHVIFCHQEESSWPLQDAAAVKKRFDDIFGATRYTQALGNIKMLKGEWIKVTRDRRAEADLSQAHMDQATKLQSQREDKQRASEEIMLELKGLDEQIIASNDATQRAEMELVQYESCGVRVQELRSLLNRCEQDRRQVVTTMEERGQDVYKEPLEVLQQQIKNFKEKTLQESEQRVRQAKAALNTGTGDYQTALDSSRKLREELGETLAAADLLTSRRSELSARLKKLEQPSVATLRAQLDSVSAEFARMEREQRQRDAASEEAVAAAERVLRDAQLEAAKNESRAEDGTSVVRRLEQEAKTLARAHPDLDALVRAMRENEAALGDEGSDTRLRRLESRQEEIGRRRHDLQYSISRKSSEVAQLEAQSDAHLEVDSLRRRAQEAEAELTGKIGQVQPRLVELFGQMPDVSDVEARVTLQLQQLEEQVRSHRSRLQEGHQRRGAISARRSVAEADLRRLQAEEGRLASELGVPAMPMSLAPGAAGSGGGTHTSLGMSDFNSRLATQRDQVELARKDLAMTESAQHMYERFREKSRAKNTCQFCRRCFETPAEKGAFEDSVEKLIVKIPAFLEESRRRLMEAQEELSRLDAQRPRWDNLERLRAIEIPNKQRDIAACIEEERKTLSSTDPLEHEQRRLEDRAQQLQDLRTEASAITRLGRHAEEMKAAVRAKEARLLGANSKVSLQAERDQLRTLQEQLGELGREEDAVRTQRDLLAKQQEQLRTQLAEQKGRLQLLQAQVARRGDVDSELASRKADLKESIAVGQRARAAAEAANSQVQGLRKDRAEVAARFRRDLDARDTEVRGLQRECDSLCELEKSIEVMRARVENADALKAQLAGADQAVRNAERELEGLKARLESEEERQKKREKVRECLEANLRLKSLEAEVKRNESEIAELLRDLGGRDLDALRRDVEVSRKRSMDIEKNRSFREGALTQTRESLVLLQAELSSPLYANVEQRHREAIIKHESAAYASKDLGRYHGALDKALMKFHALKMAEINKTIKELWQKVYRGRDIDYIAIRSDTDDGSEGGGAVDADGPHVGGRAMKSYNYRVVMVCGDAEMDMRGRCSAGQRVLASLIIRLALADSFCLNCGILALDEPTTNLDAANIRGLAEALAQLIEARRHTSRFQLVLITHDEVFVNHLSQLQVSDWYYHIHKDESGCSKIQRKDMRLLAS
eukprot:TRINITY_DN27501_c0_g1_i1.p1 TRINITY_DN27501_c0_g1~~TRINITY_DN27501_c0_g1_i1.p1  ORF type:complete len:1388 (-),score=286.67 TRINITY_DN27501_c0_g1_i1:222-4232(-)